MEKNFFFKNSSIKQSIKYIWKFIIKAILMIVLNCCNFKFLKKNMKRKIYSKTGLIFIVCLFGKKIIKRNDRIRKYFYVLNRFIPNSQVIFSVSNFTKIDPKLIHYKNINISIERYEKENIEDVKKKYTREPYFYFNGLRFSFYQHFLNNHPEIKYVVVSDDDTLFFRDPFSLINRNPAVVHIMEDIYPFSKTQDGNFIWLKAWANLNNKIKEKCGFKPLNKELTSNEIKNLIPFNSGLMIGNSKNIIKISELISRRFLCPGIFPDNAEQGLLNYLELSGELKEINITIHRHNIFAGSFLSCPELMPIENYSQQINSNHLIAIHHHHFLNSSYIIKSPFLFQLIFNMTF